MITELYDYYHNMTDEQKKQAYSFIEDETKLLLFIAYSYNINELVKKGNMSLITNPDAIFMTREQEDVFITELKKYLVEVAQMQMEREMQNVNTNDN